MQDETVWPVAYTEAGGCKMALAGHQTCIGDRHLVRQGGVLVPVGAQEVGHANSLGNIMWLAVDGANPWGNAQECQIAGAMV